MIGQQRENEDTVETLHGELSLFLNNQMLYSKNEQSKEQCYKLEHQDHQVKKSRVSQSTCSFFYFSIFF